MGRMKPKISSVKSYQLKTICQELFELEISRKLKMLEEEKNIFVDLHLKGNRLIYLFNAIFDL